MRKLTPLLFCISVACSSGPGRVYHQYPPRQNPETVNVIYAPPKKDYIVLADFECINMPTSWVQAKAAKYGADAVYIASFSGSSVYTNSDLRNSSQSTGINQNYICTAIKYK